MAEHNKRSALRFYRLIRDIPEPRRADRSADGMISVRAYRYCEPLAAASALGWYIYPPLNFSLLLEDNQLWWTHEGANASYPVAEGAQFPGFQHFFDENAPEQVRRYAPTFLAPSREPGQVQIWSGYLVRTSPRWALLSRAPANIPNGWPYRQFEGLIETNHWFGPLFTNIRLTRSNTRVDFHVTRPLFQVQLVPRQAYSSPAFDIREFDSLRPTDWQRFEATMTPNANHMRRPGHYAVDTRKRLHAEAAD